MGTAASNVERDDELLGSNEDLGLVESNDDELLGSNEDLGIGDISKMKRRPCSVDPKLAANPRRKAPPINPKTCKEGTVSTGKDGQIYVISGGRWIKAERKLDQRQKELIKERLSDIMSLSDKAREKAKGSAKKAKSPTPAKRSRGRPKGSAKKAPPKTPARKRCPNGSRKGESGKCIKK